jgi:hypothetical protein
MHGIKIGKSLREGTASKWPGEYAHLDVLLRPIAEHLRPLWWATEHAVYTMPPEWILEPGDGTLLSGPSARAFDASFVSDAPRPVAGPGFLPTYARVVSGDWSAIYGLAENPATDRPLLDTLGNLGFFAEPAAFPPAGSVVVRGIDWAYWEVFARDRGLIDAVQDYLRDVPGLRVERLDPR